MTKEEANSYVADWLRFRAKVLDEVWKQLRDTPGGPNIEGMGIVAGMLTESTPGEREVSVVRETEDDAWGSVWLHGKWSWLTKNMTTPERELAADAVERWNQRLCRIDGLDREPLEGLRWWRG